MGVCLSGSLARSFSRTLAGEAMARLRTGGGLSTVTPYLGAGFWSPNKKFYGRVALDNDMRSIDNSESIKHPRRWLRRLMDSLLSLAK